MARTTQSQRLAVTTYERLAALYPDAECELTPREPFQLLVAVVLSAQTTDVAVNRATPALFQAFPTPSAMAAAPLEEIQDKIKTIGMFRQKAKHLKGLSALLMQRFGGRVPQSMDELVQLPGVGRKTANVVLGVVYGKACGVVVDTHVQRLSQRLGWSRATTADAVESDLLGLFPKEHWIMLSHILIFHGRRVCMARNPDCARCAVSDVCPSAGKNASEIGRKPSRSLG